MAECVGKELPDETIILPEDGPKSRGAWRASETVQWANDLTLDVFPNPTAGAAFAAYEVPDGMEQAELHVCLRAGQEQVVGAVFGADYCALPNPKALREGVQTFLTT